LTTKIHMLADGLGRPLRLIVTAGQAGDAPQAQALLEGQVGEAVLAEMGAQAVIPSNRTRKILIPHDEIAYKQRNRIERCFNRLKHFRRFATRYERRTLHFKGFAFLAASMIWMN